MLNKELKAAITLASKASEAILKFYYEGFEIEEKFITENFSEPVTIADKTASKIIVDGLSKFFPDDAILSEEEPDDTQRRMKKSRVWIIDPLDGTKGFTQKQGDFAVQIGLVENGEPILGVVLQPLESNLYFAVKNEGAFLQRKNEKPQKLKVSDKKDFESMILAVSRAHRSKNMNLIFEHFNFKDELRHGSVGLKVGFLAQKSADMYVHMSPWTKYWDTAAPEIILEESGGKLTNIFGEKIRYDFEDVRNYNGIFASNGVSHEEAVSHLKPLLTQFGRLKVVKK